MLLDFTTRQLVRETFVPSASSLPLLVQMEFPTLNLFHSEEERKYDTPGIVKERKRESERKRETVAHATVREWEKDKQRGCARMPKERREINRLIFETGYTEQCSGAIFVHLLFHHATYMLSSCNIDAYYLPGYRCENNNGYFKRDPGGGSDRY